MFLMKVSVNLPLALNKVHLAVPAERANPREVEVSRTMSLQIKTKTLLME